MQAEQYIDLFGSTTQVHADDLVFIDRHLLIRRGVVLDVGCGPGHLTARLRTLGVDSAGVDLVPSFIDHARQSYPDGRYELGSMHQLPVPDHSVAGILAWYSLIHLPPDDLDDVLAELRRVTGPRGTLVAGFFDGDEVEAFEHEVATAYYWPVDEFGARLRRAGYMEVERWQRPGVAEPGRTPQSPQPSTDGPDH